MDAGNSWWGAPGLAEKSQGAIVVEAMNLMTYDAMALGPAELALGEPVLRQRLAEATFPVLAANVFVPSRGELLTRPYIVLTVRGRQVGVIGLTSSEPVSLPVQERVRKANGQAAPVEFPAFRRAGKWVDDDLVVLDAARALARYLPKVQETADIIVLLSNLGWAANVRLAEQVPGIDVIISAGPGDLLTEPWQATGQGTFLCQGGAAGQEHPGELVGEAFLQADSIGTVTQCLGAETVLMPQMKNAPAIVELVRKYRAQ
jgi:5'-nucleotidase/UDP-sugar diphosphatase